MAAKRPGVVWLVSHHRDTFNHPFADKIIHHVMLAKTIVPHPDGARRPAVADGELWLLNPARQISQNMGTFWRA